MPHFLEIPFIGNYVKKKLLEFAFLLRIEINTVKKTLFIILNLFTGIEKVIIHEIFRSNHYVNVNDEYSDIIS